MLTYKTGDIFESDAQALVNPVNCVGVMGKGLALEFRLRYMKMFLVYMDLCRKGEMRIGRISMCTVKGGSVLLFPTKKHWRDPSKVSYIEKGLMGYRHAVLAGYMMFQDSIAFPALGCGLGGLDFDSQVRPLMEKYLSDLPIDVQVYTSKE
jgi:O-acetyl-ADP-ribose deacetylase (regulator of RNase III)